MKKNSLAIVTGASRGIGRAISLRLAHEGYDLALFGRSEELLSSLTYEIKKYGRDAVFFAGDVSDGLFVNESVNQVILEFGKIEILVNNAGMAIFKTFIESSLEEFKAQINTNLYGVYNFTKAVLPNMIENKGGTIINISSLAGKNPFVGGTMYSASKHALMGFSKSLMLEVRQHNIRVAAVCPGSVGTEMLAGTSLEPENLSKVLTPDDIAQTVSAIIQLPPHALISEVEVRPTNPK